MEVKHGYKLTEVGVIPETWLLSRVVDLGRVVTGGTPRTDIKSFWNGDIPWVTPTDINASRDMWSSERGLTPKGLEAIRRLPRDSVLVTCIASIGKNAILKVEGGCNQQINAVIPNQNNDAEFLYYLFEASKQYLLANAGTTATSMLSKTAFQELRFGVPSLPEQRAIATALSDVDALLGGLDRLIAKKRDLKQAAMQQLLTGQIRLPGFSGEWEVKRLGEAGTFLKGSGVKKDEANSGDLPCIRYGEIYTHHNDYIRSFNSWISSKVAATATRLRQGDLLFAGSGETKEDIGKCVAFVDDREAFAGGDIVILRLAGANPMFMGYYCNTAPINAQKASKGQGDAVVHISSAALSSVEVTLPSYDEQSTVAAVLSDMDAELAALESRRTKTRAVKQAMMQELLTGKTRLVPVGAVHA